MRILYGVMGEGLGHVMRSHVMAQSLSKKHNVLMAASSRAVPLLRAHRLQVVEIDGLVMHYAKGSVGIAQSLTRNVRQLPSRLKTALNGPWQAICDFNPDVIVTDFDSFTHAAGIALRKPIVTIDHQHALRIMKLPGSLKSTLPVSYYVARAFVSAKMPACQGHIATSFWFGSLRRSFALNSFAVGPILRPEVFDASSSSPKKHIVVYRTADDDAVFLEALENVSKRTKVQFEIHGGTALPRRFEGVSWLPFSEQGFLAALKDGSGLVTNGGYTAISEALALRKPILSRPLAKHGEQLFNAACLQMLNAARVTHARETKALAFDIEAFVRDPKIPQYDPRWSSGTDDALKRFDALTERLS